MNDKNNILGSDYKKKDIDDKINNIIYLIKISNNNPVLLKSLHALLSAKIDLERELYQFL
jgi:hypothetical protein